MDWEIIEEKDYKIDIKEKSKRKSILKRLKEFKSNYSKELKFINFNKNILSSSEIILNIVSVLSLKKIINKVPISYWINSTIYILKYSGNLDWRIGLVCSTTSTCIFLIRNRKIIYFISKYIYK